MQREKQLRKDYHNVNWVELQRRVDRLIDSDDVLQTIADIDRAIETFQQVIVGCVTGKIV